MHLTCTSGSVGAPGSNPWGDPAGTPELIDHRPQLSLVERQPEIKCIPHARPIADLAGEFDMTAAVADHDNGEPILHRGEAGLSGYGLGQPCDIAIEGGQFVGVQVATDLTPEAAGSDLDGGADPVAVSTVVGVGAAAVQDRDGEELGPLAADADVTHGPLPANF
jgi:hypothetical protein